MVFGGLQKNSFIDYPGKISCVLFTRGCNFDCPYCHNPELVTGGPACETLPPERVYDFLEQRRGFLEGVVISGGEPTLQKDLADACAKIKRLGYPVKIDTNGSHPEVIRTLVERHLVDYIAMDVKTDPAGYAPLITRHSDPDLILASIRLIMSSGLPHEFRTTCIKPIVDEHTIDTIARIIAGARLYALQNFQTADVLHPEFFTGNDCIYGDADLKRFREVAAPHVVECIIR